MIDDDIPIPAPRAAKRWVCTRCGEDTGEPQPGMLLVDPRYAIGYCRCTPGKRTRVHGYHRELINLVADFAFDRAEWQDKQASIAMKKAFEKVQAGMPASPEEHALAARYKVRFLDG